MDSDTIATQLDARQPMQEVEARLNTVRKSLDELSEQIRNLEERLTPVLDPKEEDSVGESVPQPDVPSTPLGQELMGLSDSLRYECRRIERITQRLGI